MALYKYRLYPLSPFVSPVQSDTLAGHLLCAAGEIYGVKKITELIDLFKQENPPFSVSSGFPADCLPMPFLPGLTRQKVTEMLGPNQDNDLSGFLVNLKSFKKKNWLSLNAFQRLRDKFSLESLFVDWMSNGNDYPEIYQSSSFQTHNSIDRRTDTVMEGGLYFSPITAFGPDFGFDIYVENHEQDLFETCLDHISRSGYGADSSTGKGSFSWERINDFDSDLFSGEGSHKLLLSHCAAMDMSGFYGYYRLMTRYGKVWSGFGESNPFKKPFALFRPGSIFSGMPKQGYVLENIHSNPDIVQITHPLCVAVNLEEGL